MRILLAAIVGFVLDLILYTILCQDNLDMDILSANIMILPLWVHFRLLV